MTLRSITALAAEIQTQAIILNRSKVARIQVTICELNIDVSVDREFRMSFCLENDRAEHLLLLVRDRLDKLMCLLPEVA